MRRVTPAVSIRAKGLRSAGQSPLLLAPDDIRRSVTGKAWGQLQTAGPKGGVPHTMADWFDIWGTPVPAPPHTHTHTRP